MNKNVTESLFLVRHNMVFSCHNHGARNADIRCKDFMLQVLSQLNIWFIVYQKNFYIIDKTEIQNVCCSETLENMY